MQTRLKKRQGDGTVVKGERGGGRGEQGYITPTSEKGDVRMFDRLGLRAKIALHALDEPIIGLDVSADGRWILATCRTYLMLIDALRKDGKNEGYLGLRKSLARNSKLQPWSIEFTKLREAGGQAPGLLGVSPLSGPASAHFPLDSLLVCLAPSSTSPPPRPPPVPSSRPPSPRCEPYRTLARNFT